MSMSSNMFLVYTDLTYKVNVIYDNKLYISYIYIRCINVDVVLMIM